MFYLLSFVLYLFPGALILNLDTGSLKLGFLTRISSLLSRSLFFLLIILLIAGKKRDKIVREKILIWSLVFFAVTGFGESVFSLINQWSNPIILFSEMSGDVFVSIFPYLIYGVVLIYYFGSFLISSNQPKKTIHNDWGGQYKLSPREKDVIPLIGSGMSNLEIADKMGVSLATVKSHIHNVYRKTGVKNRFELYNLIKK